MPAPKKCSYPNCERFGMGYDVANDGTLISCPRKYNDGAVCNEKARFQHEQED